MSRMNCVEFQNLWQQNGGEEAPLNIRETNLNELANFTTTRVQERTCGISKRSVTHVVPVKRSSEMQSPCVAWASVRPICDRHTRWTHIFGLRTCPPGCQATWRWMAARSARQLPRPGLVWRCTMPRGCCGGFCAATEGQGGRLVSGGRGP